MKSSNSIRIHFIVLGVTSVACVLSLLVYSMVQFSSLRKHSKIFIQNTTKQALAIGRIDSFDRERDMVLTSFFKSQEASDAADIDEIESALNSVDYFSDLIIKEYDKLLTVSQKNILAEPSGKLESSYRNMAKLVKDLKLRSQRFRIQAKEALTSLKDREIARSGRIYEALEKSNERVESLTDELNSLSKTISTITEQQIYNLDLFFWILGGTLVAMLIIMAILKWIYSQLLIRPLKKITRITREISEGGRDVSVEAPVSEEFEALFTSIRKMERSISQAEFELKEKSKRLEKLNNDLSSFSHTLAHDFKNPLGAAIGMVDIVNSSQSLANTETKQLLRRTYVLLMHLNESIDDLLELSEAESKRMKLYEVDLNKVVEQALGNLRIKLHSCNAALDVGPLPKVKGRESLWVQIFQNLISNSIKFKADRKLEIKIFCEMGRDKTHLFVKDNGLGMEKHTKKEIFKMFYRGSKKVNLQGHGIGLSAVKRIVEKFSGEIRVDSEPDIGTTFEIIVPSDSEQYTQTPRIQKSSNIKVINGIR